MYTKDYYPWCMVSAAAPQGYVGVEGGVRGGAKHFAWAKHPEPLYLIPKKNYTYWTPPWLVASGHRVSTSPFPSFWY